MACRQADGLHAPVGLRPAGVFVAVLAAMGCKTKIAKPGGSGDDDPWAGGPGERQPGARESAGRPAVEGFAERCPLGGRNAQTQLLRPFMENL
jgi:hypothetical protein